MKLLRGLFIVFVLLTASSVLAATGDPVQQLYTEGLQAIKSGDAEKAVALLSQVIALNGLEARYYNDRGVAYKRLGDLDKALADYTKAIQLRPGYTHALNNRGLVYLEQGKYDLAIADFSEALKHGELQSRLYTNMGLAKAKQGDYQGAIKDFDKAFTYQPMDHRSFIFMAESLEKTGDLEKALRTYQLARNVLNDPDALATIQSRINQLEIQKGLRPTDDRDSSKKIQTISAPSSVAQTFQQPARPQPQRREIARAQPFPDAGMQPQKKTSDAVVVIDSFQTLDDASRNKALTKYSGPAREIYTQGQDFMAKSDAAKALIRFEDARQLERRNKNVFAVAWCDVEIARVHTRLGDYVRADRYLRDALRLFEALKADDQVILTLLELAETSKHLMEKDKALSFYARARDKAASLGYEAFAKQIADMAAGKKVSLENKTVPQVSLTSKAAQQAHAEVKAPIPAPSGKEPATRPADAQAAPSGRENASQPRQPSVSRAHEAPQKPQSVETTVRPETPRSEHAKAGDGTPLIFKSPQQVGSKVVQGSHEPGRRPATVMGSSDRPSSVKKETSVEAPAKKPDNAQAELPAPPAARHKALAEQTRLPKMAAPLPPVSKPAAKEPSLREDLILLRDLKKKNDAEQMVPVLERLGRRYYETANFEKSNHAYTAAIDLREKLGMPDGVERLLEARAASRENLGNLSDAMEDLVRSLYLGQKRGVQPDRHLMDRLTKLSKTLGVDRDAMVRAFQLLWDSRAKNDSNGELQALLTIASMYDRAGRFTQALAYYDRAAASVTANKAQILEKMGDERLAEQQWTQALDTLKNLDYSAYIHIMKQSKILGARALR
ncbi:MAG: tetratricopeptide repeat protein [Desulfomonilaceae bacterium]